jgi:uncharacterized protein (DUF58 family)
VLRILRELLAFRPRGTGTHLAGALEYLNRVQHRRSLAFVLSDFQDRGWERDLRIAGRRHEIIALPVSDPRERRLPDCGLVELQDPESGERFLADTSDPMVRNAWQARAETREAELRSILGSAGVDHLMVPVGSDYVRSVAQFLRRRALRD